MADDPTRYLDVSGVLALKPGATVDVDYTLEHARSVAARHRELGAAVAGVRNTAMAAQSTAQSAQASAAAAVSTAGEARGTATNTDARVTALESAAGFGPSAPVDGQTASLVLQSGTQTGEAVDARARARTRTLYPEDFGAVGDGTTDDTAALQAWLASDSLSLRMGAGTYLATRPLTSTQAGRAIWADGGWIKSTALEQPALTVTGTNTRVRLGVNGTNKARVGIMVKAGGCDTSGSEVVDCRSTTSTAAGIWAETAFGFRCVGARIERIHSAGNMTTGDSNGAARGIYLGGSGIVAARPSLIADNEITDITGEEGDSIQVIATVSDTTQPFGSMLCTVRGNTITNFSRRAIKIQASDVAVLENSCTDLTTTANGSEHRVIYVLNTDGCRVERNFVRVARAFTGGVSVTNEGGVRDARHTVVRDNIVAVPLETTTALIVANVDGAVVTGNRTDGGAVGVNVTRTINSKIEDNVGSGSPRPVVIFDTVTQSHIGGNKALGGGSGPVQVEAVGGRTWARTYTFADEAIPSNTVTRIRWTGLEGNAATVDSTGIITPAPGRYIVHAAVAGTPANASGFCYVQIITDPNGTDRYERHAVASRQLQTWSASSVVTIPKGGRLWVNVYHTTGADLPMNSTSRLPFLSLERLD